MIIANRKCLLNGNSFILGVSGSGKSFTGKCEIANLMLAGNSDIIIIDPEREYAPLVKAMGGAIIDISATSKNHINAMDMKSCRMAGGSVCLCRKNRRRLKQSARSCFYGREQKADSERCFLGDE